MLVHFDPGGGIQDQNTQALRAKNRMCIRVVLGVLIFEPQAVRKRQVNAQSGFRPALADRFSEVLVSPVSGKEDSAVKT